jgi:hypothetical protein
MSLPSKTVPPLLLLAALALPARAGAEITFLGSASIPGDATDKSGLTDTLADGTPHNRLGSLGSGIAYTGRGDRYFLVADRGPQDGAVPYRCRFHVADITVRPGKTPAVQFTLVATTLLTTEAGKLLVGAATAFDAMKSADSLRFDPEGVRVGAAGTLFISDEYGPHVWEFGRDGKRLRRLQVPDKFAVARPKADAREELAANKSGRVPNRGLEGLAITPDGGKLYAILQSPLIQDWGFAGRNVRLLELPREGGPTREYVYPLDSTLHGINEILAVNDREFLVLERDSLPGDKTKFKKLMKIDVRGATDVSGVAALPKAGLPQTIKPVSKKPFLDLLDPKFGLTGPKLPAKVEGLTFGPDLPDGRHLLLVTTDNDFKKDEPTWVYAFAIGPKNLPGYKPQVIRADGAKR